MEYRRIGKSGLKVSEMGLGANSFGGRANEAESISTIHLALELGVNFIDTADVYADGHSEEMVGKAVKGKRSQFIIATKFGNSRNVRPHQQGGSRGYIMEAVNASLKRLETDYIDLYYMHVPDSATPIEETIRTLDDLVRTGKVRYIGCSNFAAWQLCEALWTSKLNNLESFVAVESRYNLLDRHIESELVPCSRAYGVGVIPWYPLAAGFLTGKYQRGKPPPEGTRLTDPRSNLKPIMTEANYDKLEKLQAFAAERGHGVGELAIAWLLSRPWISSVIAGARNTQQLSANVAAMAWKLTAEDILELDKLS